jgi:hypothetical protein
MATSKRALYGILLSAGAGLLLVHCSGSSSPEASGDASVDGNVPAMDAPASGDAASDGAGGGDSDSCGGCRAGLQCCNGQCVNEDNDPNNCGGCGVVCMGATPYCDGTCQANPCKDDAGTCGSQTCCGTACCKAGQICCKGENGVSGAPSCNTPTPGMPACPVGCQPLCVSDRDAKRDFVAVDGRDVLEALASVPMSTWSYNDDTEGVRHLGPMAQDLHAAFGLGGTDKAYDPIDAHGVAFAAIQALYERQREQETRIERLEQENRQLKARCEGAR